MSDHDITITITPDQADFLARSVADGRYRSVSEAIDDALRLLEIEHSSGEVELDRFRSLVAEGARDLDLGDTVDAASTFREARARLADVPAHTSPKRDAG